jgi:type I restriction enzyme S subunit
MVGEIVKLTEVKLKDISKNNRGYYGIGASAVDYDENKYTYLRITDINDDGTLNTKALMSVDDENACKFLLKENDIVFARTGASTGRNYFYDGEINNMVFAGFLIKFSLDKEKVNPRFIKYYCLSQNYKNWIASSLTGSTRPNINEKQLSEMPIILPDREYQDRAVKVLDAITKTIKLNNQINDNLLEQAITIFKDRFPKVEKGNDTIGNYLIPKKGKNLLSRDAIKGNVPVVAGGLEPATYHNTSNTKAPVITISASGANAGFINLWNVPVWSSDSSFIDDTITENVYFWYVALKIRQKEIYDSQTGSAQPHIYPKHIAELPINSLEKDRVNKYTKIVTPLFEMIGKNKEENKYLEQLRNILLLKLINGEMDLYNIES